MVLDRNNDLMYGTTGILSDYRGKSLATAMPGTIGGYYLFTVSTSGVPYYHVIDLTQNNGLGEVTGTINQPMDAAGGYGYGMALYEDHTGLAPTKLFLRRSAGDSTQIVSFAITGNGFGEPVVETAFVAKDMNGTGEMQLSPDGGMLAIATKYGGVSLVSGVGELRIFHLNPNHGIDSLQNFLIFGNTKHVVSFDFSPLGKYVYYTKTHSIFSTVNNKTLERYHLATGQVDTIGIGYGEMRRGKNGKMYLCQSGTTTLTEISNPDEVAIAGPFPISTGITKLVGALPLQPHKRYSQTDDHLFTRTLGRKYYELTDHLGNIRAVISYIKGNFSIFAVNKNAEIYPVCSINHS